MQLCDPDSVRLGLLVVVPQLLASVQALNLSLVCVPFSWQAPQAPHAPYSPQLQLSVQVPTVSPQLLLSEVEGLFAVVPQFFESVQVLVLLCELLLQLPHAPYSPQLQLSVQSPGPLTTSPVSVLTVNLSFTVPIVTSTSAIQSQFPETLTSTGFFEKSDMHLT